MKVLLKGLLYTGVLLVVFYAASPLWLSYLLANQLPPAWELEVLDIDYPGISGININSLRLKGDALTTSVEASASQIHFDYRTRNIEISSLLVSILLSADANTSEPLSLDDLSLPLIQIPAGLQLPEIGVKQLQLSLIPAADADSTDPVVLDFEGFKLKPSQEHDYHLVTDISLVGYASVKGQLEVDLSEVLFVANIQFADDGFVSPWMGISLTQETQPGQGHSLVKVELDIAFIAQQRLDALINQISAGQLQHLQGKLQLQAGFSGEDLQEIYQLSIVTEKLQLESGDESIQLDLDLLARSESGKIIITQGETIKIYYQSNSETGLLSTMLPQLQHPNSTDEVIVLHLNNFQLETDTSVSPELTSASGLLEMHWQENAAFVLTADGLVLQADRLDLNSIGEVSYQQQAIHYEHLGELELQLVNMQLVLLEDEGQIKFEDETSHIRANLDFSHSLQHADAVFDFDFKGELVINRLMLELTEGAETQVLITADTMPLSVELSSRAGELVSSGSASLAAGMILFNNGAESLSSEKLDLRWQQLDLTSLTGKLDVRTHGLLLDFSGETLQGFDLDLRNSLRVDGKIRGIGQFLFDLDPAVSMEYRGSLETGKWQLKIPDASIEVSRLQALIAIAHIELPEILNLTDGTIQVKADINIADEITATALLKGKGVGLSILENTAAGGNFEATAVLGEDLKLEGSLTLASLDVAGGIDLRNIHTELAVEGIKSFQLSKLQLELFGGQLKPANLHYLNDAVEDSVLEFKGMDLQRLLVFADVDGLDGSGSLDISLPIGSDSGGIYVKNATFRSTQPGHLAYLSGAAGSNIGLQALENFQYQSLSGTLDYQSDGNYQILISLNGSNPDLYDGHPIAFNLNIGGSLPELFEALFISGSFEDGIIKQIRAK